MATLVQSVARSLRRKNLSSMYCPASTLHSHATSFGFNDVAEEEKCKMVGNVFTSVASNYDLMNDLMSGGLHRLWKDRLVSKLNPFPGMKHLDVADGTGDVAFRILENIKNVKRRAMQDFLDDDLIEETRIMYVTSIQTCWVLVRRGPKREVLDGKGFLFGWREIQKP